MNPISIPLSTVNSLEISEIFYSLQGESSYIGLPMVFIRLSRCNLNCTWCDTRYACVLKGQSLSYHHIFGQIQSYPCRSIEFTGGEPLLQKEALLPFWHFLIQAGYRLLLETNGSLPIDDCPPELIIIMDVKTPSSGQRDSFWHANLGELKKDRDQLKFVIGDAEDFAFMVSFIHQNRSQIPNEVLISPVSGRIDLQELARWILNSGLNLRLQIQQHRIIWPQQLRGV